MISIDAIIKIVVVSVAVSIGCGINYFWPSAKPDNVIEQAAEEVIKVETGVDVDFSPEDKKKE